MSDQLLRTYRLSSMEEPTDEMLVAIMEKVVETALESTQKAENAKQIMFKQLVAAIAKHRAL